MKHLPFDSYDLLLFDLDDTLFHHSEAYEKGILNTVQHFQALEGIDQSDFIKSFTKHNHLLWSMFTSNQLNFQEFSLKRLENTLKDFKIIIEREESLEIVKMFQDSYLEQIRPQEELNEFLTDLSNSVRIGIITNGTVFNAYKKVDRLGLKRIFPETSVIVSEAVGSSKPNPEIFQHALKLFEGNSSRTLFIGDNYYTDILVAKSTGMDTLWINRYNYQTPKDEHPDYTLKHVLEMKGLFTRGQVNIESD
ncbi:HAD family hydrolase [Bacillus sp. BHET2]|uniref:HAD family hydrolase n=1 Tax=Bacillus sp. BHET2 TaxID=2583818 RepID=UPI00110D7F3C|nr:HAD family hydrolase [Bacillus sp. BHET2]TMU87466.1 HAD family hydrolase [Bacillus sp. BHET2]